MIAIPLDNGSANAHQQFSIRLGDNYLDLSLNYTSYTDNPAWSLDIYRDGTPLALGAMLEPNADILSGYRAGIGSLVFVGKQATLDNLGVDNSLIWVQ